MGEARKVIFTFLILLFIIIGMGVLFTRLSQNKPEGPFLGGVLDNIFFSQSNKPTPTPKPLAVADGTTGNTVTIRTSGITPTPVVMAGGYERQPNQPSTIPATGTPTAVLVLSGMGLAAGYLMQRFSR